MVQNILGHSVESIFLELLVHNPTKTSGLKRIAPVGRFSTGEHTSFWIQEYPCCLQVLYYSNMLFNDFQYITLVSSVTRRDQVIQYFLD